MCQKVYLGDTFHRAAPDHNAVAQLTGLQNQTAVVCVGRFSRQSE